MDSEPEAPHGRELTVLVYMVMGVRVVVKDTNHLDAIKQAAEYAHPYMANLEALYENALVYSAERPANYIVIDTDDSETYYLRDGETVWSPQVGCDVCGSPTEGKIGRNS